MRLPPLRTTLSVAKRSISQRVHPVLQQAITPALPGMHQIRLIAKIPTVESCPMNCIGDVGNLYFPCVLANQVTPTAYPTLEVTIPVPDPGDGDTLPIVCCDDNSDCTSPLVCEGGSAGSCFNKTCIDPSNYSVRLTWERNNSSAIISRGHTWFRQSSQQCYDCLN